MLSALFGLLVQFAEPADIDEVRSCLDSASPYAQPLRQACLSIVSAPCLNAENADPSTQGQLACFAREISAWRALTDAYVAEAEAAFSEHGTPERAEALAQSQSAWELHMVATCSLEASEYGDGSLARIARADCAARETAFRLIYLEAQGLTQAPL